MCVFVWARGLCCVVSSFLSDNIDGFNKKKSSNYLVTIRTNQPFVVVVGKQRHVGTGTGTLSTDGSNVRVRKQQYGYGVVSKQRHDHEGVGKQQHDHVVVLFCCLIYQNVENCSCGQEEKILSTVLVTCSKSDAYCLIFVLFFTRIESNE